MSSKIVKSSDLSNQDQPKPVTSKEAIEAFIKVSENDLNKIKDLEQRGQVILFSWNIGTVRQKNPEFTSEDILNLMPQKPGREKLTKKLAEVKLKDFSNFEDFINNYELEEDEKGHHKILKFELISREILQTQALDPLLDLLNDEEQEGSFSDFLNGLDFDLDPEEEDDFERGYVNRCALVIRFKEDFKVFFEKHTEPDPFIDPISTDESMTILVEEDFTDAEELQEWLSEMYGELLPWILGSVGISRNKWPKKTTFKQFQKWFDVGKSTIVLDWVQEPLFKSL